MKRAGRLFAEMDFPDELDEAEPRARAAWGVAAGKTIARHTRATVLVRGKLLVEVEDALWQRQLATMGHFFVRNLAKELGPGVVTQIDFRPTPKRRPPQMAQAMSAQTVTAYTARKSVESVEGIEDPVLGLLYKRSRGNRR